MADILQMLHLMKMTWMRNGNANNNLVVEEEKSEIQREIRGEQENIKKLAVIGNNS